jgi:putative ABC transport system substrate-binding protein
MSNCDLVAARSLADPVFSAYTARIADFGDKSRLPTMYGLREHAAAGGLMAYGPNYAHLYWRAASYVDKILKGAKPADLPVEQPTKFEFVINLKFQTRFPVIEFPTPVKVKSSRCSPLPRTVPQHSAPR